MKKRVYIVMSHHHAIREWFRYRESEPHMLSFDYHTDFREAFSNKSGNQRTFDEYSRGIRGLHLSKHIPCEDVDAAISDLKNDEQIDFAIRAGIIKKAFVFSHDLNTVNDKRVLNVPNGRRQIDQSQIFSYCEATHPLATPYPYTDVTEAKMARIVTTDEVLNEVIKTFRKYGFDQSNYILDFDSDFIRDQKAMENDDKFQTLKDLIKGAKAITIALEPFCVIDCSGQALSSDEIEGWLIQLIQSCVDDVLIESEL